MRESCTSGSVGAPGWATARGDPTLPPTKNQINKMANEIAKVAEAECV